MRLNALLLLSGFAAAQAPEIIRYTFDIGDAANTAAPGIGDGIPSGVTFVAGNTCGGAGGGAAESTAGVARIDSGWTGDLGTDSWTIGMHLDLTGGGNTFQ